MLVIGHRQFSLVALVALALAFVPIPLARAAFEILEWDLLTGVQDDSGSSVVLDGHFFDTIQNPFQGPDAISDTAVGPNTARTEYDISWLLNTGSFRIDIDHRIETGEVTATSQGYFLIQPDVDLRMTIDASLQYSSTPGDRADFIFRMYVSDEDLTVFPFEAAERGGNLWFYPAAGTLDFAGEVILPADGTVYRIDYRAWSSTLAEDNPTGPLTASGYVQFDLAPVPEPATAMLCLIAGMPVLLPRRRRRGERCRR